MINAEHKFFLFGMGDREKFIYKCGQLIKYKGYEVVFNWSVKSEEFIYDRYTVVITTNGGERITIKENESGVFVDDLCITASKLNLPDFEEYKYAKELRILHHEVLINVIDGKPVPNYFVYDKPWYRDGAMMGMVLKHTNNLHTIKNWILSITEIYDRNNAGGCEPDNLGELLYILSLVSDKDNPLVKRIIDEGKRIMVDGHLTGITDFNDHHIYSTLWFKLGLNALGIDSDFVSVPQKFDSYSRMFWMDKSEVELKTPFKSEYDKDYPYLWWACIHFENESFEDKLLSDTYPLSWERNASQAKYDRIAPLSSIYAENKFSAPHTWHASEMFLYLIEMRK